MSKKVLISGASVAGPALAYWLARYGFEPTVVELAPEPRGGGFAVDFRGPAHFTVLEQMGVLEPIREVQTHGGAMKFVDETGDTLLTMPAAYAGGSVEVLRSDLSRILVDHTSNAEYLFGDSITSITEDETGVLVEFEHGEPRRFDLVIGADGLHSNVRGLLFGPEDQFVKFLGYYVAGWDLPNHWEIGIESRCFNTPGRFAGIGGDHRDPSRAGAYLLFRSPELSYHRRDIEQQKDLLREAFGGMGWQVPRILETLASARELYFDSVSRVDVPEWSKGRAALVGDAACGATFGGMGTGTAMVCAYVLAGELALADGDHRAAFERYEKTVRSYAEGCQQGGEGSCAFLAPETAEGIRERNEMLSNPSVMEEMLDTGEEISSALELRDYPAEVSRRGVVAR